jgi:PAS domain S-box-containing protein
MEALQVLILDPHLPDVQTTQTELQNAGFNCTYKYLDNATDFQVAIINHSFDLILCEYVLPDANGLDILAQVRSQFANLPFIIVTNNTDAAIEAKLLEAGATDVVLKQRLARLAPAFKKAIQVSAQANNQHLNSDCLETQQTLKQQVEFNRLLASISTRFIDISAPEIDATINSALAEVGKFTQVDTSYVFQFAPDYASYSMLYEWVAGGIAPKINQIQNIPYATTPWANAKIRRGEVLHIADVDEIPVTAVDDRAAFKNFGLKALVVIPLSSQKKITGWIGLASLHQKTIWSEANINLLRVISEIFANALRRRQTEALLQEAYQRLDFHVNNSPLAVIEWDAQLRITRWSKQAEAIFGWQAHETLGRHLHEWSFVHIDDFQTVATAIKPLLDGTLERMINHNRNYTKNGAIVYCGWYNSILRDQGGKIKSILSLVADLTLAKQAELELEQARNQLEERVQTRTAELIKANTRLQQGIFHKQSIERALRNSESRYRAIIEDQTELICRFLADGTLTFVNEAYCRYFNKDSKELVGRKFLPLIPAEDIATVAQSIISLNQDMPVLSHEHRVIDGDGRIRWQQWTNRAIFNDRAKIVEYQAVGRDITEQKEAAAALIASEKRYRAVVEDQTEMVCRSLADTTLIFVNEAYCRYYQASKQDLIDRHFLELIPLPDRHYVADQLAKMTPAEPLVTIEHQAFDTNGNQRWQQWNNRGIYNEQGELLEIQSVGRDITARVWAEEALRQSEAKFRQLTENIRDIIWMRDVITKRLIYVSPSYEYITGYSAAEIQADINAYVSQVVHPCDRDRIGQFFTKLLDGKLLEPETIEYRIVRADSEVRWILDRCFPVFNDSGQIYRYVGIAEDVTDRRKTEASLKQTQATNSALISALPDLLIRMRGDGIYLEIHPSDMVRIFKPGFTHVGESIYKALPLEIARPRMALVQAALQTGEIKFHEYALDIGGEIHHEEARIIACGVNEVLVIIRNINDRKEAEAKIMAALEQERELGELKSRFVSITSHEFRNPLAIISAAAQALERYGDRLPYEKKLVRLKRIQAACNYMATLLNDILIFGKAEAGMLEFHPASLNLSSWCAVLLEDFRLSQEINGGYDNQVKLDNQIQPTSAAEVFMDERLLRHILINLLSNAVKYSPGGQPIDFVVSNVRDQNKIIFQIHDRGLGIPASDLARLFEPFHRAQNVKDLPGTGLGMSIVKKSVDMHGGEIQVETELGQGSTFTVILPS